MKTAGRENPNHGVALPRNRAHGAVGQNRSRSIKWAEKQENFRPTEVCFFLTSTFIELTRTGLLARFAGFGSTFCAVTVSIQVCLEPVERFPLAQCRERSASLPFRQAIHALSGRKDVPSPKTARSRP